MEGSAAGQTPGTLSASFLGARVEHTGRFVILPGSASCRKSGAPQGLLGDGDNDGIRICSLPPHMPQPNPAEGQRKSIKRATMNRPHGSAGQQRSVNAMLW